MLCTSCNFLPTLPRLRLGSAALFHLVSLSGSQGLERIPKPYLTMDKVGSTLRLGTESSHMSTTNDFVHLRHARLYHDPRNNILD